MFTEPAVTNGQVLVHILDRTIMPNIESGQNILFLDAFLAHFGAPMQEWLEQPNVSSKIGLKGIAAHLTKYVIDSQSKSNIIFLHHRYVQLGDVGFQCLISCRLSA